MGFLKIFIVTVTNNKVLDIALLLSQFTLTGLYMVNSFTIKEIKKTFTKQPHDVLD